MRGKKGKIEIQRIGVRHGEKHAEALLASEERSRSEDLGTYFKVPLDTRSLDYQIYFEKGQSVAEYVEPYTSSNTAQLKVDQVAQLILDLPEYNSLGSVL